MKPNLERPHLFLLFFLPWNQVCAEDWSSVVRDQLSAGCPDVFYNNWEVFKNDQLGGQNNQDKSLHQIWPSLNYLLYQYISDLI